MKKSIVIEEKIISEESDSYIAAEIGLNHNRDIELAKRMILEAKKSGADAVKFQTYITEKLIIEESPAFKLFKDLELSKNQFKELSQYSKEVGITFFSTPFCIEAVEWLEEINIPCYKIASMDIDYYDLLKACASTGKPVILSTGMSSLCEIEKAIEVIEKENNNNIVLLHTISKYPPEHKDMNLNMIKKLKEIFPFPVGFSDHSLDNISAIIARSFGAVFFEKHFTLSKNLKGPDHSISLEPHELVDLREKLSLVDKCLTISKERGDAFIKSGARRGLYAAKDIKKDETIKKEDILAIRPLENALPCDFINYFINRKTKKDIKKGEALSFDLIN